VSKSKGVLELAGSCAGGGDKAMPVPPKAPNVEIRLFPSTVKASDL
jgi:hypothetical protein